MHVTLQAHEATSDINFLGCRRSTDARVSGNLWRRGCYVRPLPPLRAVPH